MASRRDLILSNYISRQQLLGQQLVIVVEKEEWRADGI